MHGQIVVQSIAQNCLKFHLPNGSWNTYTNITRCIYAKYCITTNHAITYTHTKISWCNFRSVDIVFQFIDNINKGVAHS